MDTIAAIATSNSVSAIGIIRISGDAAIDIASRIFVPFSGKPLSGCEDRRLVYGKLVDKDGGVLDICLCTVSRSPNSYTGENTAELQCHGSPVVLRCALDRLFELGARQALPGEFTKRAFLNGKMTLTEAEAVIDVIEAETASSAKNAIGQLDGALKRKTDAIYSGLADICSHYHAVLDYPDEDIEDFTLSAYEKQINGYISDLTRLLDSYRHGKLMNSGIPAAIIGKPNAGKSSLLNALLGYDRAIVTEVPGTTRDTIEEKLVLGKLCLRLTDTAGIRESDDRIEMLGVERSFKAAEQSDLVIAVIDGSDNAGDEETGRIISAAKKAPHGIIAVSKSDINAGVRVEVEGIPTVYFSSVTGEGLGELETAISGMFPEPNVPCGEILTNVRHKDAVARSLASLQEGLRAMQDGITPDAVLTEVEAAMTALGELDGRTLREDITNRIFERFCVGK